MFLERSIRIPDAGELLHERLIGYVQHTGCAIAKAFVSGDLYGVLKFARERKKERMQGGVYTKEASSAGDGVLAQSS